jgi:tetratricopeptide (TPR) repeat protein
VDHIKLFRNDWPTNSNPRRFSGNIHEQVMGSIYAEGGIIEPSNLYVVHAGYDYSPEGQAKKRERDYTILAKDEAENPSGSFPRFNYGMTYLRNGEFDLAIQKLHECIERSTPFESTLRSAYSMLAEAYEGKRDLESTRATLDMGLALTPNDSELLFRSGNLYHRLGDAAAAEKFYLRLFNHRPDGQVGSLDVTVMTYKGRHNYALVLKDLNRFDDAEAQVRIGLANNPTFAPSWHLLGDLFVCRRRFDDARAVLEKLEGISAEYADMLRGQIAEGQRRGVV